MTTEKARLPQVMRSGLCPNMPTRWVVSVGFTAETTFDSWQNHCRNFIIVVAIQ